MATRRRLKNFPAQRDPHGRKEQPNFNKGYDNKNPKLPGSQFTLEKQTGLNIKQRKPSQAEVYYEPWKETNSKSNLLAEAERVRAEKLLQETKELIAEAKHVTRQDNKEVDVRFRQRVGDIAFWKAELEAKLTALKDVLDDVDSQKIRCDHALGSCGEPLAISEACLADRMQRQGVDKVADNVEKHLEFEVETIKNSQILLRQTSMQIAEELRQLNKARFNVEKDLEDKEAAIDIDSQTSKLAVTSLDKKKEKTKYAIEKQKTLWSPADWQTYTEKNLQAADIQLKNSVGLQSTIDGILAHVASHLRSQKDLTDRAFERRIEEYKLAKKLLEEQLSETIVKVNEIEESVESLEKAIGAKQGPLATCQLRIQKRKQRPNYELVLDDVDLQLQTEAANLIESINRLEEQLAKSRNCYGSLQKSRLELENQIAVKNQSIYIDEVKCMTMRQAFVIQAY